MATKTNDIDFTLRGKNTDDLDFTLQGVATLHNDLNFVLRGVTKVSNDLDFTLRGKNFDDLDFTLGTKNYGDLDFILEATREVSRRFTLLDTLRLRDSSVYRNPRDISTLKLVYGALTSVGVPCTPLDEDGTIYHISDRPIMAITKVYIDGEPKSSGYQAYTAWQDETGRSIAAIIFDNPQYNAAVTVSCKGTVDPVTGLLIENPADLIRDILLNVQEYDEDVLDQGELSRLYADCLREEIIVSTVIDNPTTIKALFDDLARNIHARWLISDGKSVMRLRWL